MSGYLLDTHTLLWALGEPEHLSPTVRAILDDPGNDVVMSVANTWEIAIKMHKGGLGLPSGFLAALPQARAQLRFGLLEITEAHVVLAGGWQWGHRDPFDRLLAAQAVVEGRTLLSRDSCFRRTDAPTPPVVTW